MNWTFITVLLILPEVRLTLNSQVCPTLSLFSSTNFFQPPNRAHRVWHFLFLQEQQWGILRFTFHFFPEGFIRVTFSLSQNQFKFVNVSGMYCIYIYIYIHSDRDNYVSR